MTSLGATLCVLWAVSAQVPPAPSPYQPGNGEWVNVSKGLMVIGFPPDAGQWVNTWYRLRPDDGGTYALPNVRTSGPEAPGLVPWNPPTLSDGGFVALNRQGWCWQAAWSNDAGVSPWSMESCFRYDLVPPTAPTLLPTGVTATGGLLTLSFGDSIDNESGILHYHSMAFLNGQGIGNDFKEQVTVAPSTLQLGTGAYTVAVRVYDRAGNAAVSSQVPVNVVSRGTATLTPPTPPRFDAPKRAATTSVFWTNGNSHTAFRYRLMELDGGLSAFRPWVTHDSAAGTYGFYCPTGQPMVLQTAAIDSAGNISAWSADSPPGGCDSTPPPPPIINSATTAPGGSYVDVSFTPAPDYWSGVDQAVIVARCPNQVILGFVSADAGTVRLPLDAGMTCNAPGDLVGIIVGDFAFNESTAAVAPIVTLGSAVDAGSSDSGAPDAAVDAGAPDAGRPDAGTDAGSTDSGVPDSGQGDAAVGDAGSPDTEVMPGVYAVSCGCQSEATGPGWLALLLLGLLLRRHVR